MQAGLRRNSKIVSKLVTIRNADEVSISSKFKFVGFNIEMIRLRRKKVFRCKFCICSETSLASRCKFMRDQCIKAETAKHARKLLINEKSIHHFCFSVKNNVHGLFRIF